MNHIYKVIWNTITQTWVAVSELSRAKGKTKSSKTLSAVVLAAVSAGAIVGGAEAAINYPQGTHTVNGMAIGTNSYANRNSVAYGEAAKLTMDIQLQLVQMQLLTGLEMARLEYLPIEE